MEFMESFGFRGYRSFGPDAPALLSSLTKINLIAGQNNSGKSNILRALVQYNGVSRPPMSALDRPQRAVDSRFIVFASLTAEVLADRLLERYERLSPYAGVVRQVIREIPPPLGAFEQPSGRVWIGLEGTAVSEEWAAEVAKSFQEIPAAQQISSAVSNLASTDQLSNLVRLFQAFGQFLPAAPPVHFVEGTRFVRTGDDELEDLNGTNILRRLLALQNPGISRLSDRARFDEVQQFVREVLEDELLEISVPHDASTMHVRQGDVTLPIENIGMGVHEVIILAVAATVTTESILCIEEPEVHLHPLLQRKLVRYLLNHTTNQYFVATHSAHMLDLEGTSVYHVERHGVSSSVTHVQTSGERSTVCVDLGYRPSDLVQANAVIWVEGPSDRIYLNAWLEFFEPGRFVEGIHFSIMFYGGSLVDYLTTSEEGLREFVELRKLNRFVVVVIDSDRGKGAQLKKSKVRLREELQSRGGDAVVWITEGYTIENYVPVETLDEAVRQAHPSLKQTTFTPFDKWNSPLKPERVGIVAPNKPAIARRAVDIWPDRTWPLDLRARMQEVVDLISRANVGR